MCADQLLRLLELFIEVSKMLLDALSHHLDPDASPEAILFHDAHLNESIKSADKCLKFLDFLRQWSPSRRCLRYCEAGHQFSIYLIGLSA